MRMPTRTPQSRPKWGRPKQRGGHLSPGAIDLVKPMQAAPPGLARPPHAYLHSAAALSSVLREAATPGRARSTAPRQSSRAPHTSPQLPQPHRRADQTAPKVALLTLPSTLIPTRLDPKQPELQSYGQAQPSPPPLKQRHPEAAIHHNSAYAATQLRSAKLPAAGAAMTGEVAKRRRPALPCARGPGAPHTALQPPPRISPPQPPLAPPNQENGAPRAPLPTPPNHTMCQQGGIRGWCRAGECYARCCARQQAS